MVLGKKINENDENDEETKLPMIYDRDGFTHRQCPVSEASQEICSIISDTLYCIDTNTLPDAGGCMDQTSIFRTAFTTILHERERIKNEREKEALDKAKHKGKGGSGNNSRTLKRK